MFEWLKRVQCGGQGKRLIQRASMGQSHQASKGLSEALDLYSEREGSQPSEVSVQRNGMT